MRYHSIPFSVGQYIRYFFIINLFFLLGPFTISTIFTPVDYICFLVIESHYTIPNIIYIYIALTCTHIILYYSCFGKCL